MKIKPIWISTIEHINEYNSICQGGRSASDITSRLPESFPYIKIQQFKFPIVFFSTGELYLKEDLLIYSSKNTGGFFKRYNNLNNSLF